MGRDGSLPDPAGKESYDFKYLATLQSRVWSKPNGISVFSGFLRENIHKEETKITKYTRDARNLEDGKEVREPENSQKIREKENMDCR